MIRFSFTLLQNLRDNIYKKEVINPRTFIPKIWEICPLSSDFRHATSTNIILSSLELVGLFTLVPSIILHKNMLVSIYEINLQNFLLLYFYKRDQEKHLKFKKVVLFAKGIRLINNYSFSLFSVELFI